MTYRHVWQRNNAEYRAEALTRLRQYFPVGAEVTTLVTHVARSDMSRAVMVLAVSDNGRIANVSGDVARVLDSQMGYGGVRMNGCGMDMCFALTYELARTLYHNDAAALAWLEGNHASNTTDVGYSLTNRTL